MLHASPSHEIDDLLPLYDRALRADGRRERGRKRYCGQLDDFAGWLGAISVQHITTAHCRRYQEVLVERGCRGGTLQVSVSALRSFFRWCVTEQLRPDNPALALRWPKRDDPPIRTLAPHVRAALRSKLELPPDLTADEVPIWQRNRRAVMLMWLAGLRISEVVDARWGHVLTDRRELIVHGKGGKRRVVPINRTLWRELMQVPERVRADAEAAIVPTVHGAPYKSYKSLAHIFERWMVRDLGLTITAHQLRHAFALQLLEHGVDVRQIQMLLGHSSLETTMTYLGVPSEQLRHSVERLDAGWM